MSGMGYNMLFRHPLLCSSSDMSKSVTMGSMQPFVARRINVRDADKATTGFWMDIHSATRMTGLFCANKRHLALFC